MEPLACSCAAPRHGPAWPKDYFRGPMSALGDAGHASAENDSVFGPFYDRTSDQKGSIASQLGDTAHISKEAFSLFCNYEGVVPEGSHLPLSEDGAGRRPARGR